MAEKLRAVVIVKCIGCGDKREIEAGEIPAGDYPCCNKCGMPMVAEKAVIVASPKLKR